METTKGDGCNGYGSTIEFICMCFENKCISVWKRLRCISLRFIRLCWCIHTVLTWVTHWNSFLSNILNHFYLNLFYFWTCSIYSLMFLNILTTICSIMWTSWMNWGEKKYFWKRNSYSRKPDWVLWRPVSLSIEEQFWGARLSFRPSAESCLAMRPSYVCPKVAVVNVNNSGSGISTSCKFTWNT